MIILKRILNSFLFWGAWIIIPVLMEIIPALGGVFLLLWRRKRVSGYPKPKIFPEISIIIPVYNSQDTLFECIESIDQSTYPNDSIRIFLVNNKGQDDSFSVYARAQNRFPTLRMQWLNAEQGKSRALNLALYNSEGKYIINLDSDGLLEKHALTNLITKFEALPELNCMTGSILTMPDAISRYKTPLGRLLRELEFMEYAQAFMAGRSYASETNSVYTLSGAFSAFRKNAVLSSWMYNTDTICEDTHMTFQIRYKQKQRVEICEDAIFFVDPIEDLNKLYTQRQRWQRGSLEVAQMFMDKNFKVTKLLTDVSVRTLLYDHTFAFPRMIWYIAMICLLFMNYSGKVILYSTAAIFSLYILIGFLYFITTAHLLKFSPEIRRYYVRHWWCVFLLPFFNFGVFFIRMAGIINSINTTSSWRTKNLTEEWESFTGEVKRMCAKPLNVLRRARSAVNRKQAQRAEETEGVRTYGAVWYLCTGLLCTLGALLVYGVHWSRAAFGAGLPEMLAGLFGSADGGMANELIRGLLPPLVAVVGVLALLTLIGVMLGRRVKERGRGVTMYRLLHGGALAFGAALLLSGTLYANAEYDILGYFISRGSNTPLYEQLYVDPSTVAVTAPEKPKNLIYIYVESMETAYASRDIGGQQDVNYIPELSALAHKYTNFSGNGALGGFRSLHGMDYTMAALLASTAGVPLELPEGMAVADTDGLAGLTTLGDILAANGYRQEFLCGAGVQLDGRTEYFQQHGGATVHDYGTLVRLGYIPEDRFVNWGVEDKVLFDIARTEISALAAQGGPFSFTLLTSDLNAPNGMTCDWCGDDHPESVTGTVAACSDHLTAEFVAWCAGQSFYDDTVIVITGDHPRMDANLVEGVAERDRTVYDCFINSAASPARDVKSRGFTTLDLFPTVLASMGFTIEGDRLGLGTNLYSGRDTLLEQRGADWLDGELSKASDYYLEHFCAITAD